MNAARKPVDNTNLTLTNRNNVAGLQVFDSKELTKMDDLTLGTSIKESWSAWEQYLENFKRDSMAAFRESILPLLAEAKRRIKAGDSVNGHKKVDQFLENLGLNPGTVRMWESRANAKLGTGNKHEDAAELVKVFEDLQLSSMKSDIKRLMMNPKLSDKLRVKLSNSLLERGNKMVELAKELQTKTIDQKA